MELSTSPSHELRPARGEAEFVLLVAFLMALVALSIDMMLPALPAIGADLHVASENDRQQVVSVLFLGLTLAQLVYGPLSDQIGRKPTIAIGIGVFLVGSALSAVAVNFDQMLVGRFLQGIGVAAMRIVMVAMVRDKYEGAPMARIMSFAMSVFIIVPCLAPMFGQMILTVSTWRTIFIVFLLLASTLLVWFWWRQAETLPREARIPVRFQSLFSGAKESLTNRTALGHTLIAGLVNGVFIGYLMSSQQILQERYQLESLFAVFFALLSLSIGGASLLNARLVMFIGMHRLVTLSIVGIAIVSSTTIASCLLTQSGLTLTGFMAVMALCMFLIGFAYGNLNAIALQPLGHIAGIATSTLNFIAGLVTIVVGGTIGAAYDGSPIPLIFGFSCASGLSILILFWVRRCSPDCSTGENSRLSARGC